MANFDDLKEHRYRLGLGLGLSPFLGLALWLLAVGDQIGDPTRWNFWGQASAWVSLSPFVLASFIAVYRLCPYAGGRLGSAGQGAKPRSWREGNPAIRQPSGGGSVLMMLLILSFVGCTSIVITANGNNDLTLTSLPLMYVSLALVFYLVMSQVRWIELDIDSLRIIRHKVIRGLQISEVQSESESVRALGVCRGSFGGPFKIFAFARNGMAIPLSQEQADLKQVQFEAERLADQLMVPLLRSMENQAPETVARHLRSLADDKLPVRRDWAPLTLPDGALAHRSTYPPID
jgi:hypothetical protein